MYPYVTLDFIVQHSYLYRMNIHPTTPIVDKRCVMSMLSSNISPVVRMRKDKAENKLSLFCEFSPKRLNSCESAPFPLYYP